MSLKCELWTLEDTMREFHKKKKEPATISIHKWESFSEVLANLSSLIGQNCGLCNEKELKGINCDECEVAIQDRVCSYDESLVKRFEFKVSEARDLADDLLKILRKIEAVRLKRGTNHYYLDSFYKKRRI